MRPLIVAASADGAALRALERDLRARYGERRMFKKIEAAADPESGLCLVGVPSEGWRPFFQYVVAQRETGDSHGRAQPPGSVSIADRLVAST